MARKNTKLKTALEVASTKQLVDRTGQPISTLRPKASSYEGGLPYNYWTSRRFNSYNNHYDRFENLVTANDYTTIASRATELYCNLGAVKGTLNEIANRAIGDGWTCKFSGKTDNQKHIEWAKLVEDTINAWFEICDWMGRPWNLNKRLRLGVVDSQRVGDCLAVLTTASDGQYPMIEWIDGALVGSNYDVVPNRPFQGARVYNGVIFNSQGRVAGYNIKGQATDGSEDYRVNTYNCQLMYDPEYHSQHRGLSVLACALSDWDYYKWIKRFELIGLKALSSKAYVATLPPEDIDDDNSEGSNWPGIDQDNPATNKRQWIEELQGGEVPIFQVESGGKYEVLESSRPSNNMSQFLLTHCLKNCFLGMEWPMEWGFDLDNKTAAAKSAVSKAQNKIDAIQTRIVYPIWKRIVSYAIGRMVSIGRLPPPPDPTQQFAFEPTYPRSITFDMLKDIKADIEMYNRGWITGTQIAAGNGYDLESNYRQKAEEVLLRNKIANEQKYKDGGVKPEDISNPATQTINQTQGSQDQTTNQNQPQ